MTTTATFRAFKGNPYITCTAITIGTIASSRTSAAGPEAFFQLSAKNVTCSGTNEFGGAINPYEDLEHAWERVGGTTGLNTVAMTWLVPLVAGTPQSTTRDYDVDQVGPECAVRAVSTIAATETWRLTVRGADGAGGYVTATTTIDLTVTQPSARRYFYFDATGGNNANDGRDPWGFNVSGCTFTNSTKRLVKTGAFTAYDHTAATAPAKPYAYNFVGVVSGTGVTAGTYEIASKISDDELELVENIGGTNPTNVVLSTGARQNGDGTGWTNGGGAGNDQTICLKGGETFTLADYPNGFANFGGKSGLRVLGYGTTKPTLLHHIYISVPGSTSYNDNAFSGLTLDANNVAATNGRYNVYVVGGGAGTVGHLYIANCTLTNCATGGSSSNIQHDKSSGGFGVWNCVLERSNAGKHGILGGSNADWMFVIGGSISGDGQSAVLDHHIYPSVRYNTLFDGINFGAGTNRNYCINLNCSGSAGTYAEYVNVRHCNMNGVLRACDMSETNNNYANRHFRNVVIERNAVNGLTGDGKFLFYCCDSMTFRDNIGWNNSGGRDFTPDPQQTSLALKVYKNRWYSAQASTSALFDAPDTLASVVFRDNDFFDARAAASAVFDVDFDGAAVSLSNNRVYCSARSGNVLKNDGVAASFATYAAVDTLARDTTPNWTTPASGDFTPTYTPVATPTFVFQGVEIGTAHATQATFGWTPSSSNPNITHVFRYGTATSDYDVAEATRLDELTVDGLTPSTRYYYVVQETDGFDLSAATAEQIFETGPQGAPQTDGTRIILTSGSNRTTSGNAWSNPDRVDGPDSGDFANVSLTNQISDALTGTIPATVIEGTVVGCKFGVKGYTAAAPDATATFSFSLGNVAQGIGGSTNGDPLPPTTTETEYEVDVVLSQGTWAGLQAAIAAGMTAGVGESLSVVALNSGLTPTDFRVSEAWLVPVLAAASGGGPSDPTLGSSMLHRSRGRDFRGR